MEVLKVSKTSEWYLCSMSLSIAVCISLASVVASAAGEHFVLTCLSRGITADAVTSFSPDKASVKYDNGLRTSTIVPKVKILYQTAFCTSFFFRSYAKTRLRACCCSTIRDTISNVDPHLVETSPINLRCGKSSSCCFSLRVFFQLR